MTEILKEPNWILLTLLGAVVGYIFPYLLKLVSFIFRHFFSKSFLEGKWYSYYKIYENGEVVLKEETWIIKTGFNDKLKVFISTLPNRDLSYNGTLVEERGQILVELKAVEYGEHVYCRYSSPIPGNDTIMKGFWLGVDFNGYTAVGAGLLSRNEIDEQKILEHLNNGIEQHADSKVMRIRN